MIKKPSRVSSSTIKPSSNFKKNRLATYLEDFSHIKPFTSLIVNFEGFYDTNMIKSILKRMVNLSKNNISYASNKYLMIDVIYDYYTIIDNEDESINIFDSVDNQYVQGFRIKIEPADKMKLDSFIESSYEVIMYIYKKFLDYDNFVVSNYAILISLRASSEFNTHLHSRLTEADFKTISSIKLNRIRKNKSLLTIPIKDKYNIKTLVSLVG